jgi:hypothetical protein
VVIRAKDGEDSVMLSVKQCQTWPGNNRPERNGGERIQLEN